ncbi:hypothetical protein lerEdw1_013071 [Lerista edwardsae]|nr:hypothetical protein lerEdw1_013071 [Lerista edwardsae]
MRMLTMASVTPSFTFKEFCPLYYLLNAIPTKIQKGFRSIVVYLTALDTNGDYIAVGSSIGMLYLYCRHLNQMKKYNFEGKSESITVVKLLSCFDDLVAVGTASGKIAVFQLVSSLPGRNKQLGGKGVGLDLQLSVGEIISDGMASKILEPMESLEQLRRFNVSGIHKSSITALAWSPNGMKLFSGDDKGKIVYSALDLDQMMIGSLEGSGDIVSVSCTENEIFLLKGDRDIIRISSRPEGLMSIDMNSKLSPFSDLSPKLQSPHSVVASVSLEPSPEANQNPSDFPSHIPDNRNGSVARAELEAALLMEKIRSQSFDGLGDLGANPRRRGCSVASESRSRSSSMNSVDSSCSFMTSGDQTSLEVQREGQRFSVISSEDFDQELIVKPIKVKKKKKRRLGKKLGNSFPYKWFQFGYLLFGILMSSIVDRLSLGGSVDQESIQSGESQNVLREENGSETFSVLQSPESVADLTPEENSVAPELLKLPNGKNEMGLSPFMDSLTSNSCLLVAEDKVGNIYTECNWNPQSEQTDSNSKHPSQDKEDCLVSCEMEGSLDKSDLQSTLDFVEETSSLNGTLVNVNITSTAGELIGWDIGVEACPEQQQQPVMDPVPKHLIDHPPSRSEQEVYSQDDALPGQDFQEALKAKNFNNTVDEWISKTHDAKPERPASSDEEDIYGHGLPYSSSETSVTDMAGCLAPQDKVRTSIEEGVLVKSDQFAESWMGYAGPGYGILSLVVSEKYIWCLDYKGGLYCSALPTAGLRWQKFEENVQQVAVSPSGTLLWKVEQKTSKAFACGKVTIKGKRHWYEALPQTAFVSLSDDTAWIIRTNGDLYLQTGLSVDRPCARAVKVDCPYPLSQVAARNSIVWALTEQRGLLYCEGMSSFCPEGEQWKSDIVSEMQALEPVCITLGDQQTIWVLDIHGNLWFRTGVCSKKPQGDDNHWWQVGIPGSPFSKCGGAIAQSYSMCNVLVSITDYVVFDQSSLFQTIIQATQTVATAAQAPVEKVADRLRTAFWSQQLQCQPSLLAVNSSGVWISSGKNEFHVAKGSLIGTFWNNVVPRGTASATKWAFVLASAAPTKEGSFLWLGQSNKDLFCVSDQNPQFHPSTVQLPPDGEMVQYSACQDAIWGLDHLGQVFIRTLSPNCPTGMHWTKLDLAQLGAVKLIGLACGNQHIWACDSCGGIYFRVGTQPLNPSLMLPAWIMIEPPVQPVGINLISVYSSPNDQSLWAIDSKWNVHVRTGITEEMPVGTDWEQVPGLQACQLTISTRTVWARCPNGDVARRYGITDKNPAGDYWKKIPGNVSCLTATPLDELWAIGASGYLLQRLTKTFHHSHTLQKHADPSVFHSDDFEDEWEVI